jgi:hypothetical protein
MFVSAWDVLPRSKYEGFILSPTGMVKPPPSNGRAELAVFRLNFLIEIAVREVLEGLTADTDSAHVVIEDLGDYHAATADVGDHRMALVELEQLWVNRHLTSAFDGSESDFFGVFLL